MGDAATEDGDLEKKSAVFSSALLFSLFKLRSVSESLFCSMLIPAFAWRDSILSFIVLKLVCGSFLPRDLVSLALPASFFAEVDSCLPTYKIGFYDKYMVSS